MKLVWLDLTSEERKVYLLAIRKSQFQKWESVLSPRIDSDCMKHDQAIFQIKKEAFAEKNIKLQDDDRNMIQEILILKNTFSAGFGPTPDKVTSAGKKPNELQSDHDQNSLSRRVEVFREPNLPVIEEQHSFSGDSNRSPEAAKKPDLPRLQTNKLANTPSDLPSDSQSNMGARSHHKKKQQEEEKRKALAYKQLSFGQVFLKYGKFGLPKQKHVFFDGKSIKWRANIKEGHKMVEKSSYGASKKKGISLVETEGEINIQIGRHTKIFKSFKVDKEREEVSFTITGKKGRKTYELNLQAATKEDMHEFIANLLIICKDFKPKKDDNMDTQGPLSELPSTPLLPKKK